MPRQIVKTLRGIRKYSMVRASANEFGGIMHTSDSTSTKLFSSKAFGLGRRYPIINAYGVYK